MWVGGTELLAGISGRTGLRATPTLQYVAVRDGLLWAGDRQPYLETALAGGEGPSDAVADLADSFTESPAAAVVYTADHACEALSMRQADDTDRATGDQLLARAGKINPVTAFAMGLLPGGGAEALLGFENDDQARTNADTRAVLAAGPAPGQGGDFSDRFAVDEVTAEGTLVRMVLDPEPGAFVLSDLSSGPVLFATC